MYILSSLQHWWRTHRPGPESATLYETACWCGYLLRGQRQHTAQTVACASCGRKCLILPSSPWPKQAASGLLAHSVPRMQAQAARPNLRRLALVLFVCSAAAMALVFLVAWLSVRSSPKALSGPVADARSLMQAGQRALSEGNVRLALKELNAAVEQRDSHPDSLSREEHRQLHRLRRQCDLLARLLDNPLEDILQQALRHHDAEEWQAKFEDYRGRTVVFDDVLRPDVSGRPALGFYVVRVGEVEARLALEDLALLRQLPLDPPRRWLFGARLASCRREKGGVWVFHFEPDSAVLLTDETAAAACCPPPLDDELRAVLRRQDEWLPR